jgi:cytochrome c-type biogenesis protein
MIEELFTQLTLALSGDAFVAAGASLAWGIASILLSPCHLSSIPLIVGYITAESERTTGRAFILSTIFASGILLSIAILGVGTAALGRILGDTGMWGNILLAALFLLMGLALLDIIRLPWVGYGGTTSARRSGSGIFMLGLMFGLGLGPCTFAFLAPILGLVFSAAFDRIWFSVLLLAAFAIGHIAVIVAAGTLTQAVARYLAWTSVSPVAVWLRRSAGILVLLAGVYNLWLLF